MKSSQDLITSKNLYKWKIKSRVSQMKLEKLLEEDF